MYSKNIDIGFVRTTLYIKSQYFYFAKQKIIKWDIIRECKTSFWIYIYYFVKTDTVTRREGEETEKSKSVHACSLCRAVKKNIGIKLSPCHVSEISRYNLPTAPRTLDVFAETRQYSKLWALSIRGRHEYDYGNASARDRGWKTYALLLGDGNEIHETSRVTVLFCMPMHRSLSMPPAIIENTEMQTCTCARECRGAIDGGPISF